MLRFTLRESVPKLFMPLALAVVDDEFLKGRIHSATIRRARLFRAEIFRSGRSPILQENSPTKVGTN